MSSERWSWEPTAEERRLATVPEQDLADRLREAIFAVGYLFDAWWPEAAKNGRRASLHRATMIETVRMQVAALGRDGSLDQLAEITKPLLGDVMETDQLQDAVELIRNITMSERALIRRCRESVARWESEHPA